MDGVARQSCALSVTPVKTARYVNRARPFFASAFVRSSRFHSWLSWKLSGRPHNGRRPERAISAAGEVERTPPHTPPPPRTQLSAPGGSFSNVLLRDLERPARVTGSLDLIIVAIQPGGELRPVLFPSAAVFGFHSSEAGQVVTVTTGSAMSRWQQGGGGPHEHSSPSPIPIVTSGDGKIYRRCLRTNNKAVLFKKKLSMGLFNIHSSSMSFKIINLVDRYEYLFYIVLNYLHM